jgi:hypothetical protein
MKHCEPLDLDSQGQFWNDQRKYVNPFGYSQSLDLDLHTYKVQQLI